MTAHVTLESKNEVVLRFVTDFARGLGCVRGRRDEVRHRVAWRRAAVAADDEFNLRLLILAADRVHRPFRLHE